MRPWRVALSILVMSTLVATGTTAGPATAQPRAAGSAPAITDPSVGARTDGRAVVVIEGGGSPHPFTTPWAACDRGRSTYVQALVDAGLPVFTAPGYGNTDPSTAGQTGCPLQPPLELQWNTAGYPTQAGVAVLGLLGWLHDTYGYTTFDLVGYSWGGVVARATVAALKKQPSAGSVAPAFSYAQKAVEAGIRIPSIVTLNSPHLGGPAYDIADNPKKYYEKVARAWGRTFADSSESLVAFQQKAGAGSNHILSTTAHAKADPASWDAEQVGLLEGVALTLIAGDYCGRDCGAAYGADGRRIPARLRTDGTVPVYSQLMLPCTASCPRPPGSVHIPQGLLPSTGVVRRTFPTVHSGFVTGGLGLPSELSVSKNPEAVAYLVDVVTRTWTSAGVPVQGAAAR